MLPKDTAELWNFLKEQRGMRGFILIGGSALSLRIGHRISEDLDVVYQGQRLPSTRLSALVKSLENSGFFLLATDDPGAAFEFEVAGLDLRDYQQDFLVNEKVKLTFFTPDQPLSAVLDPTSSETIRVASLDELFASKALICASRSTIRDWFDLRTLISDHGYSIADMQAVFERVNDLRNFDLALQRLCSATPGAGDPGLAAILTEPPSANEVAEFFRAKRAEFEAGQASRLALERLKKNDKC
jgi:predicted nucleotidyltransferase component of viral defense system